MNSIYKLVFFMCASCLYIPLSVAQSYDGPKLGVPSYNTTDDKLVNVTSGTISHDVSTVAIGNASNFLSHHISINANDALNIESYLHGYKEKYMGGIRTTLFSEHNNIRYNVISVFDHEGSYEFDLNNANNTFTSHRKDQMKLERIDSTHLQLTKPDGTKVVFKGGISNTFIGNTKYVYAYMTQINRPDGFTIDIHRRTDASGISSPITSVTSNTGLQLKYIYSLHNRPLDASKLSSTNNPNIEARSDNWSVQFPTQIIALNNAVEVCPLESDTCNLTHDWPTATFSWPDGMPRAFYVGNNIFSITDAKGLTTAFHHGVHKTYMSENYFVPRIKKIVLPTGRTIEYTYSNEPISKDFWTPGGYSAFVVNSTDGVMSTAKLNSNTTSYHVGAKRVKIEGDNGVLSARSNDEFRGVEEVKFMWETLGNGKVLSGPYYIETCDKIVHLSKDFANQVTEVVDKMDDYYTLYKYDSVGRIVETETNGVIKEATYSHYRCNEFNCNKPSYISNAYSPFHGFHNSVNTSTKYSYYTGQLEYIIHPANALGVRPAKRYNYQLYTARFKNQSGVIVDGTKPISLLSSEVYCQNSNPNGTGTTCYGNDKITIDYHYGSGSDVNNLFLLGTTFSSQHEATTYTTCFEYDKYGNRIGESQPKSGISVDSCNLKKGF